MNIERKDNVFKVSIPAITDDEIRAVDNNKVVEYDDDKEYT